MGGAAAAAAAGQWRGLAGTLAGWLAGRWAGSGRAGGRRAGATRESRSLALSRWCWGAVEGVCWRDAGPLRFTCACRRTRGVVAWPGRVGREALSSCRGLTLTLTSNGGRAVGSQLGAGSVSLSLCRSHARTLALALALAWSLSCARSRQHVRLSSDGSGNEWRRGRCAGRREWREEKARRRLVSLAISVKAMAWERRQQMHIIDRGPS